MLSARQLLEKISLGETSSLEFKSVQISGDKVRAPRREDLSDEIAAFANHQGGIVIFGVSDNRVIEGVGSDTVPTLINFISELCHASIEPRLVDFSVEAVTTPDEEGSEKILVYIEISKSLWIHKSSSGYFLRSGSSKREMTTEQLGRLLQARSQARIIRFDEQFVPDTNKSAISKDLFTRFLHGPNSEEQENKQLLKRNLLIDDNGNHRVSVAGLLMCSNQPDRYLNNSFIRAVCYAGLQTDANYQLDAQDFTGPLDKQIIDSFKFVERYNKISASKDIGRVERPQYSMRAIFEALVNAVVHRDYSLHESKIRLFIFADRLELYSPGALVNTITVETLQDNQATRNELLSRLLSEVKTTDDIGGQANRMHFLERRGEGVSIILNESEELSGKAPVYEMPGEQLRLTIFAAQSLQDD